MEDPAHCERQKRHLEPSVRWCMDHNSTASSLMRSVVTLSCLLSSSNRMSAKQSKELKCFNVITKMAWLWVIPECTHQKEALPRPPTQKQHQNVVPNRFELKDTENSGLYETCEVKKKPLHVMEGTCPRNGLTPASNSTMHKRLLETDPEGSTFRQTSLHSLPFMAFKVNIAVVRHDGLQFRQRKTQRTRLLV